MGNTKPNAQIAGLGRFNSARKEASLRQLRAAADEVFSARGYHSVSTEDIALAAGVTRKTFYQHFSSKNEIAFDVYKRQQKRVAHFWSDISNRNYHDASEVYAWLDRMVEGLASSAVSRVFVIEFTLADDTMRDRIRDMAPDLVHALGKQIPEFAFAAVSEANEDRFAHACLLVNQIVNQITMHNAGLFHIRRALIVDRLAKNFQEFIRESAAHLNPEQAAAKRPGAAKSNVAASTTKAKAGSVSSASRRQRGNTR